jgi:hypothetical protein
MARKAHSWKIAVIATATLAFTLTLATSPASATNSVRCSDRGPEEFVRVAVRDPNLPANSFCYANAGTVAVNHGDVSFLSSGNNKVTVQYESGGRYYYVTLEKWTTRGFSPWVRVFEVRIW